MPIISIIIPVLNEAAYIDRCLQSIIEQDYEVDLEVLIAEGMSSGKTRSKINDLSQCNSRLSIHIIENQSKIVPTGLNI